MGFFFDAAVHLMAKTFSFLLDTQFSSSMCENHREIVNFQSARKFFPLDHTESCLCREHLAVRLNEIKQERSNMPINGI